MGFKVLGDSGNVAEVDSDGQLQVNTPQVINDAGYTSAVFEVDAGSVTGAPLRRSPRVSQDFRLGVGIDTVLFTDNFNSTAQNTGTWRYTFSSMTATMSGGSLLMNSNSTSTGLAGCQMTTWRHFTLGGGGGLRYESILSFTQSPSSGQVVEWGLFPHGASMVAPVDGVFFRWSGAGLIGVVSFGGNEGVPAVLNFVPTDNQSYQWKINLDQKMARFFCDDILLGSVPITGDQGYPAMRGSLPISFLFRNETAVSGSPIMQMKAYSATVVQLDQHTSKPWSHQQALQNLAYQGQNGGSMGSLALYTNSYAPSAFAMTNTAASLGVGLGGHFAALPTLTTFSDGIVCSYLNPAGTANITPRTLIITGVRIQGVVQVVLVGGPVIYAYSLAFGHTSAAMNTSESGSFASGTAKAPRRIPLGFETYAANAAVATLGQSVSVQFQSPVVVHPGEYVAIAAKNIGTATSSGTISFLVSFDHYME